MNERANRYISILYRYGQRYLAAQLKPLELDVGLLPAFLQACRQPGISQDGIAQNTGMDKGTTARSVKQLEERGYIVRTDDPDDRRINRIRPTEKALALFPRVEAVLDGLHDLLYRGFTPEETETALRLLRRMKENLSSDL